VGDVGLAPETSHLSVGVSNSANPSWTFLMNEHHLHDHNRPFIVEGGCSGHIESLLVIFFFMTHLAQGFVYLIKVLFHSMPPQMRCVHFKLKQHNK